MHAGLSCNGWSHFAKGTASRDTCSYGPCTPRITQTGSPTSSGCLRLAWSHRHWTATSRCALPSRARLLSASCQGPPVCELGGDSALCSLTCVQRHNWMGHPRAGSVRRAVASVPLSQRSGFTTPVRGDGEGNRESKGQTGRQGNSSPQTALQPPRRHVQAWQEAQQYAVLGRLGRASSGRALGDAGQQSKHCAACDASCETLRRPIKERPSPSE